MNFTLFILRIHTICINKIKKKQQHGKKSGMKQNKKPISYNEIE